MSKTIPDSGNQDSLFPRVLNLWKLRQEVVEAELGYRSLSSLPENNDGSVYERYHHCLQINTFLIGMSPLTFGSGENVTI